MGESHIEVQQQRNYTLISSLFVSLVFMFCFRMSSFCYGLIGLVVVFSAYSFPILFALEANRFILIC